MSSTHNNIDIPTASRQHPTHRKDVAIASSARYLPGWAISGRPSRKRFQGQGHVLKPGAIIHRETKQKKGKKSKNVQQTVPVYPNDKFSPWQVDMATALHEGKNVIADVVTSCGKTWAGYLTTAYEVLAHDSPSGACATSLIIAPNSEVMRDGVNDICENHTKQYNYSKRMLDTMTINFATFDEKRGPHCQILVIAVECVEEFVTDPVNESFVKNLKIIVFDEVHLGPVTRALWWTKYIPHTAQLALLSATLGDPDEVKDIVTEIQSLQKGRPRETVVIKYSVRPIPLQPLVFKGCDQPNNGPNSSNLTNAKRMTCLINKFDPTPRDLTSLLKSRGESTILPDDREKQYLLGQKIVSESESLLEEKLTKGLEDADVNASPENIYNCLCYLFSNDLQPVMVFNTTEGATEDLCKRVISHISQIERKDEQFCLAEKQLRVYEKAQYRSRDTIKKTKAKVKSDPNPNGKSKVKSSVKTESTKWTDIIPDTPEADVIDITSVHKTMQKWRFPSDIEDIPSNIPQWISDALSYGIGVYVRSMPVWQRHFMFDLFREGKLRVLFSDATISVGINLPIRTVIMCGYMSHSLHKQASGRAGRRGLDDRGYIVHMMPKEDIRRCLTTKTPEVHLHMPTTMTHANLIRLLIPSNLLKYYQDDDADIFSGSANAEDIAPYSDNILTSYLNTLDAEGYTQCIQQISMIHNEAWHYHRLTNIVKTLPEAPSIIIIKMLSMGVLHKFQSVDFINLLALLFHRVEWKGEGEPPSDFYVPTFDVCPGLMGPKGKLQKASKIYGLDIDFTIPIHNYFHSFCRNRHVATVDYLPHIEAMGEWLYTFKRGLLSVTPKEGVHVAGKRKLKSKPVDKFVIMVSQVDTDYMAARVSTSV